MVQLYHGFNSQSQVRSWEKYVDKINIQVKPSGDISPDINMRGLGEKKFTPGPRTVLRWDSARELLALLARAQN